MRYRYLSLQGLEAALGTCLFSQVHVLTLLALCFLFAMTGFSTGWSQHQPSSPQAYHSSCKSSASTSQFSSARCEPVCTKARARILSLHTLSATTLHEQWTLHIITTLHTPCPTKTHTIPCAYQNPPHKHYHYSNNCYHSFDYHYYVKYRYFNHYML